MPLNSLGFEPNIDMNKNWHMPRWETAGTAFKDCASTLAVWNDPPLMGVSGPSVSPVRVGRGAIYCLDDASIAALSAFFPKWRGKKLGCLLDTYDKEHRRMDQGCLGENLLPRYLFQAGILCQRLFPSDQSGFVDDNRLFFWPVSLRELDIILWINSTETLSLYMRSLLARYYLRSFLEAGGELYLGGKAREFIPYLLDDSKVTGAYLGLQHLRLEGDGISGLLTRSAASLHLFDDDGREYLPEQWDVRHFWQGYEVDAIYPGNISLITRGCFAEHDVVILEWQVINRGVSFRKLSLSISGDMALTNRPNAMGSLVGNVVIFDLGLRVGRSAYLGCHAKMQGKDWAPRIDQQTYAMDPVAFDLKVGDTVRGCLAVGVSFVPISRTLNLAEKLGEITAGRDYWQRAEERWGLIFSKLPRTGESWKDEVLQKAIATLVGNTWQPPEGLDDGNYGRRRIIEVQRHTYPSWVPYESGFYAVGVRHLDPTMARDLISVFTSVQQPDGWIPILIGNASSYAFRGLTMVPALAFGAWQTYMAEPSSAFLRDIYGGLCRNVEWWYRHRQPRGDGVFGFAHAQEGRGDDHPSADEPSGGLRTGMKRFISPDACGFMLMEMHCLRRMSVVLGQPEDTAQWQSRIEALNRRTLEVCYDANDNMFRDVDIVTGRFHKSVSPWHFVPLWAGVPLEPKQVQDMIRRYLLDQLLGDIPFPITSRHDPAYLPDVYWRGPSWPQLWLVMLQVLAWYGFCREAENAVDRIFRICHDNPYIMEIYDSRYGAGLSLPQYSFAAAVLLDTACGAYQADPPWRNG